MKKRILSLLLTLCLICSLCACGKSEQVQNVENIIASIKTVTIDSGTEIETACNAYAELSEKDKTKVENYETLITVSDEYSRLVEETYERDIETATNTFDFEKAFTAAQNIIDTYPSSHFFSDSHDDIIEKMTDVIEAMKKLCYPDTHIVKPEYVVKNWGSGYTPKGSQDYGTFTTYALSFSSMQDARNAGLEYAEYLDKYYYKYSDEDTGTEFTFNWLVTGGYVFVQVLDNGWQGVLLLVSIMPATAK